MGPFIGPGRYVSGALWRLGRAQAKGGGWFRR